MLLSHLRIFYRILLRHKSIFSLNIIGMTIGLTISIILGSYCISEYSYDSFNQNVGQIYQVWANVQLGPNTVETDRFSSGTAEEMLNKYPEILSCTRKVNLGKASLSHDDKVKFVESDIVFTDKTFFELFTFPIVEGNSNDFNEPNIILISESARIKYFRDENPIGEVLSYNDTLALRVGGVFKDVPERSSLKFNFVISFSTLKNFKEFRRDFDLPKFGLGQIETYLQLRNHSSSKKLEELFPKMDEPFKITNYHLEPLKGAHVRNYGNGENSRVSLFAAIAVILFIIININSMNVTASLNIERMKEIVLRKINGASRGSIINLFYAEALVLSLISICSSYLLAIVSIKLLQSTLSIPIDWQVLFLRPFIYWVGVAIALMTVAGGFYPALVLSTTKPVLSLISQFNNSTLSKYAKWLAICIQFIISSTLIFGALLMQDQLYYFKGKDLGIDIKDILVFQLPAEEAGNYRFIKNRIMALQDVSEVGGSNISLFNEEPVTIMANPLNSTNSAALSLLIADKDFIKTLKIVGVDNKLNPNGIIINEAASKSFFESKNTIGSQINMGQKPVSVVAIVRDFNFEKLKNKIGNLGITIADDSASIFKYTGCYVYVKLASQNDRQRSIEEIEKVYKELIPVKPFSYSFLEETYQRDFKNEGSLLKFLRIFAIMAIFISVFGLVGLLMFQQKIKMTELSIRKVLGASSFEIGYLVFKELLLLMTISLCSSIPISIYLISYWFQSFQYKADLSIVSLFYGAGVIFFIIIFIGIFFVSKASNSNPIRFLRKE